MRVYTVVFQNVSVSAAQDFFSVVSTGAVEIHSYSLGQAALTSLSGLQQINVKTSPSGWVVGSGGTAVTPNPIRTGDAAATFTARCNDTARATSSGGFANVDEAFFNPLNGLTRKFPAGRRPASITGQGMVIGPVGWAASTLVMSGTLTAGELQPV